MAGVTKAQSAGEETSPSTRPLKCYFCGGVGHIKTQCAKLKASWEQEAVSLVVGGEGRGEGGGECGVVGRCVRKVE